MDHIMTNTNHTETDLFSLNLDELAEVLGSTKDELAEAQAVLDAVKLFSYRIKEMRASRGITRAELGRLIGVSEQRVAQLESGTLRNAPNIKNFATITHVLKHNFALDTSAEELATAEATVAVGIEKQRELEEKNAELTALLSEKNMMILRLKRQVVQLTNLVTKLRRKLGYSARKPQLQEGPLLKRSLRGTTSAMTSVLAVKKL